MNAYLPTLRHHHFSNSYECIILDPKKKMLIVCKLTKWSAMWLVKCITFLNLFRGLQFANLGLKDKRNCKYSIGKFYIGLISAGH